MQNYEVLDQNIQRAFAQLKAEHPQRLEKRLNFSWSNWGFGLEPLERSLERLAKNDIRYVELHGNHYGDDLGYDAAKTKKVLADYGIACAGVCGMFARTTTCPPTATSSVRPPSTTSSARSPLLRKWAASTCSCARQQWAAPESMTTVKSPAASTA